MFKIISKASGKRMKVRGIKIDKNEVHFLVYIKFLERDAWRHSINFEPIELYEREPVFYDTFSTEKI